MESRINLIPLFLAIKIIVPDEWTIYIPEYTYDLNKTTVVLRNPLQTTQLTSKVICSPAVKSIHKMCCRLQNITFLTTVTHKDEGTSQQVSKEELNVEDDFQIEFDESGVQKILMRNTSSKMIQGLVKEIAYQFSVGVDMRRYEGFGSNLTHLIEKETSLIGICTTKFNISTINEETDTDKEKYFNFRTAMSQILSYIGRDGKNGIHLEKHRNKCNHPAEYTAFLNGMEVGRYVHTIKMIDDKLNILTELIGQLPSDPWHPSGSPVFKEITQLNLTNVNFLKTPLLCDSNNFLLHVY